MNDRPDVPLDQRINRFINLLLLVAGAFAYPSVVLFRRDIGRRYAGLQALLSIVLLFFWPIFDPLCDPRPIMWLLLATLFMSFVARMQGLRRKAGGDPQHRLYDGYPRLLWLFRGQDEVRFKRFVEPAVVFCFGGMLGAWSPLVAYFLWASAVGLALTANATEFAAQERVDAMRDQYRQQQQLMERFRRASGK